MGVYLHMSTYTWVSTYTSKLAAGSAPKHPHSESGQRAFASLPELAACPVLQVVAMATAIGVLKGSGQWPVCHCAGALPL